MVRWVGIGRRRGTQQGGNGEMEGRGRRGLHKRKEGA